ncbi:MAG: dTDP-4-amino-4,6-dideoxygalactose transaminase [Alteromonas macleodii]|jgi:dTDP-4-amino-4,6-dideoxygalactose transaminase
MSRKPIYVTQSFLPPMEEYTTRIKEIWESGQLTNNGPNVLELELKLKEHLGVKHVFLVTNGTIALQIAIKALELKGEVITTPFSYVATVSSIVWEGCTPVFVDINSRNFCMDTSKIEAAITKKTTAILATHVYGFPCDVIEVERIAKKHNLRVIYDAAHAFGVKIDDNSVLNHGDLSTLSFHATKIFHSGEGGAIVTDNDALAHRIESMRNFGHDGPEAFQGVGINGKVSEFHAAMGLCVLPYMNSIVANRQQAVALYTEMLAPEKQLYLIAPDANVKHNAAYFPVVFPSEKVLLHVINTLKFHQIFPRRYFYPTLNTLPYVAQKQMSVAEDISSRVLCLPLSSEISKTEVKEICDIIRNALTSN